MNAPKPIQYLLRLGITLGAAYLVFSQVHLNEVMPLLSTIPLPLLVAALVLTHAGQIISALRTRYYLRCQGIDFPIGPSIRLHYVGGLFNVFLPGGAGGDVYKAWWLKRHKSGKLLNMVKLMIAGRLNGLWALGLLLCGLAYLSAPIRQLTPAPAPALVWLGAAVVGTVAYSLIASLLLKEPRAQQLQALPYSLGLQLCLVIIAFLLASGLDQQANALEYVILFMLSCMLAMLPISIGGIGVRELALLHGSRLLGLSEETGVTLAFSFTILSLTIPLAGAFIHHFYAPQGDQARPA